MVDVANRIRSRSGSRVRWGPPKSYNRLEAPSDPFAREEFGMPAEKGGTLIEYSLLLALISLVTVASIYQVQEQITLTFWRVSDATQGSPDPGTPDGNPGDTAGRPAGTEGSAP